jgi:putative heme iron utilization protein
MATEFEGDSERGSDDPGMQVRGLMRRAGQATLASALARGGSGRPYASLVLSCVDHDASPVLLLSDLADHTRNLKADPRVSLLFDGTQGLEDPLTGPRASVLGLAQAVEDEAAAARLTARFVARHPSAADYAGFGDFRIYRVALESAHLVAGFGRIHWLEAADFRLDTASRAALAGAEPQIVKHMNHDHGDALTLIAAEILGLSGPGQDRPGWIMTGIDPEGFDLRRAGRLARADFDSPIADAESARAELARLIKQARSAGNCDSFSGGLESAAKVR